MPAKSLEKLLNSNADGGLGDIVRRARDMGDLVGSLQAAIPPEAAQSIVAANIRDDGTLVVLVRSPAWASRLRFETESLIAVARETGAEIKSCEVRVHRGT